MITAGRVSQLSFLDLVERGEVYNVESPTMWDIDFKTAVAQAEVEDRPSQGLFFDIRFGVEGGGELLIATTRPELLGACIAVVAHPDDERYRPLFGKFAITPLYGARVPILAAEHADPEKGTGILMVCTFGDAMDVEWWKQSGLALKQLIGRDGRMLPATIGAAPFESVDRRRGPARPRRDRRVSTSARRRRGSPSCSPRTGAFPVETAPPSSATPDPPIRWSSTTRRAIVRWSSCPPASGSSRSSNTKRRFSPRATRSSGIRRT